MQYIGETLWLGQLGHFMAVLAFVTAALATVSYAFATNRRADEAESTSWARLGKGAFYVHSVAVWVIAACLFYILSNKMYEYIYAFNNVSNDQPFVYTFSAFWKEQPGSFLLWMLWHTVFGLLLMRRAGNFTKPVMAVFSFAEAFLASMLLGLYYGDAGSHLGVSPFELTRDMFDAPIFGQADYLSKLDGNGLNPLLQNYWNVIHPPTLFLGFASTLVPFAFAIGGIWLKEHKAWIKAVLPWALFSGAILGTGILMGGAWAYEALSFGGYWAWDPVENASLVPWLIMVAGIHTALIARATGRSVRSTYFFFLLSFVMILYSTYLTRSGILGDTSAHAFTEMGLGLQLVLFILTFLIGGFVWFAIASKDMPRQEKEEEINTREFWMFIGSMILLFSSVLITGATSLPIWNKLMTFFNPDYQHITITDQAEHHNRVQLWIGVFMGLLSGIALFLRYNERNWAVWKKKFNLHLLISLGLAAVLTFFNAKLLNDDYWRYMLLLFAGCFAIVTNLDYILSFAKGNLKLAASAVSHLGFGLLILGVLYSGINKSFISSNPFAMEGLIEGMGEEGQNRNVLLMKEAPMPMKDGYVATYLQDSIERQTRTFTVQFDRIDQATGKPTGEQFRLQPNVMYDRQFTKVVAANPSTEHYWNKDIFTLISSLPKAELEPDFAKSQEDSLDYQTFTMKIGDTVFLEKHYVIFDNLTQTPDNPDYQPRVGDLAFGLQYRVGKIDDPSAEVKTVEPVIFLRRGQGGSAITGNIPLYQFKARLREAAFESILSVEDKLQYQSYQIPKGGTFTHDGFTYNLLGMNDKPTIPNYAIQEGEVAVAAVFEITAPDGQKQQAEPILLLRSDGIINPKVFTGAFGLHTRFEKVDPEAGLLTFSVASMPKDFAGIPVDIVEDAPRSDYIVMEAIVFPGINLVWLGSILMMVGLAMGWGFRRRA